MIHEIRESIPRDLQKKIWDTAPREDKEKLYKYLIFWSLTYSQECHLLVKRLLQCNPMSLCHGVQHLLTYALH